MIYKIKMEKYEIKNISVINVKDIKFGTYGLDYIEKVLNLIGHLFYSDKIIYFDDSGKSDVPNYIKLFKLFKLHMREQKLNIILNDL